MTIDNDVLDDTFPSPFEDATDEIGALDTIESFLVSGVIVDLDGDAYPEVVLVHGSNATLARILRNNGGVLSAEAFDTEDSAYSVTAADIDIDGYPDLVTSPLLPSRWPHIFLNDGVGNLITPPLTAGENSFWYDPDTAMKVDEDPTVDAFEVDGAFNGNLAADLGDLNGDGLIDFYFSQSEGMNQIEGHTAKADKDRIYLGGDTCP